MKDTVTYIIFISEGVFVGACSKVDFERNREIFMEDVDKTLEFEWPRVDSAEDFDAWKAEAHRVARQVGYTVYD